MLWDVRIFTTRNMIALNIKHGQVIIDQSNLNEENKRMNISEFM